MGISLEAARKNAGLTQAEFGKIAGVTEQTVNRWENGKSVIDAVSFIKLAEVSQIPVGDLVLPQMKEK